MHILQCDGCRGTVRTIKAKERGFIAVEVLIHLCPGCCKNLELDTAQKVEEKIRELLIAEHDRVIKQNE